jgi:tetratricopeptide (TPR) repeat protein
VCLVQHQKYRKDTKTMSKKSKRAKQKKKLTSIPSQADKLFDIVGQQILHGDYEEAVSNCERLLNFLPQRVPMCADVLSQMGTALAMLQEFPRSYEAFTEALALDPNNAELWYNRGMASRYTLRIGRSFRDYERAKELNTIPQLKDQIEKEVKLAREMAEGSMKERGPNFTLDQLIEQEDLFQRGLELMMEGKWEEAGQAFQASIAMGDCLPQPWGNLGNCLMMQERYDEAEAALRRALAIDPKYTIAKNNLALLPEVRRTGPPKMVAMNDPFKNTKLKQGITFITE